MINGCCDIPRKWRNSGAADIAADTMTGRDAQSSAPSPRSADMNEQSGLFTGRSARLVTWARLV